MICVGFLLPESLPKYSCPIMGAESSSGLNTSRSSWVQGCGGMGQEGRKEGNLYLAKYT